MKLATELERLSAAAHIGSNTNALLLKLRNNLPAIIAASKEPKP